ncbi:MAG: allophanate hydrolase [Pseudomonadota bacterium]
MNRSLDIASLRRAYFSGELTPLLLMDDVLDRLDGEDARHIWIERLPREAVLDYARALEGKDPAVLPLYGIPFAIKDNIDLEGMPTTAGCAQYAYMPERSAHVVQRLIDAGAIPLGKANLDQFATGLNGTRSPYGACHNAFDPAYISGGSSSGSAVAVALGLASFSLGTDTAGSGRVPAAFNNLVGLKPTRGLLSTRGVVPACRTLDCVSIFALNAADAHAVLAVAADYDPLDAQARPGRGEAPIPARFRFGVPREEQLEFFGDQDNAALFAESVARLERLGGEAVRIDFAPFLAAARLLYEGPWVAERYAAIREFFDTRGDALLPVIRAIIGKGRDFDAAQAFAGFYRLAELRRETEVAMSALDLVLTPTVGRIHTIEALQADPIRLNSELGYYTNFMNLLDFSAVAMPAGFTQSGLPFGVTLFAPAFRDRALLALGARLHAALAEDAGLNELNMGATEHALPSDMPTEPHDGVIEVAVAGAHLEGLPLNWQLTQRGAWLVERTRTSPDYRCYALAGGPPFRPGLIWAPENGASIEVEVWAAPAEHFGSFVAGIPAPLGIGRVMLESGREVTGFICEPRGVEGAEDITAFGGWRAYMASKKP